MATNKKQKQIKSDELAMKIESVILEHQRVWDKPKGETLEEYDKKTYTKLINLITSPGNPKRDGWLASYIARDIFQTDDVNKEFLKYIVDERNALDSLVDHNIFKKLVEQSNHTLLKYALRWFAQAYQGCDFFGDRESRELNDLIEYGIENKRFEAVTILQKYQIDNIMEDIADMKRDVKNLQDNMNPNRSGYYD